jgi:FkbM family methyltransferase
MRSPHKEIIRAVTPRPVRNWLRSPAKSLGWVRDEARHLFGADRSVEMRPGWRVRCHPAAYDFAYHAQRDDPEQVSEFDGFVRLCRPGMVLFDVGAHFGLFSLAALHYGGARARALALDPSPTAERMLKIQARLNGVGARMEVVRAAAGENEGWREMIATGVNGAGYFVPPADHAGREVSRAREVTLDSLARERGLTPTHVKVDVEGAEAAVLRGAAGLLACEAPPLLFVELHNEIVSDAGGEPRETTSLLRRFGYEIFSTEMEPVGDEHVLSVPLVRVICRKR